MATKTKTAPKTATKNGGIKINHSVLKLLLVHNMGYSTLIQNAMHSYLYEPTTSVQRLSLTEFLIGAGVLKQN